MRYYVHYFYENDTEYSTMNPRIREYEKESDQLEFLDSIYEHNGTTTFDDKITIAGIGSYSESN